MMRTKRYIWIVALWCTLGVLVVGCDRRGTQTAGEQTPGPTQNAIESGEAAQASKAALVGQWRFDVAPKRGTTSLSDADIDVLDGLSEPVHAGIEFDKDGRFEIVGRIGNGGLQRTNGTWTLHDMELTRFVVDLHRKDASAPDAVVVEPQADRSLVIQIRGTTMILRPASFDALFADDGAEP